MPGKRASASQSSAVSSFAGILVAGDERDRRGVVAMGDRDPRVGRRGDAGRDAGDDLELDPGGGERLGLLAAAAEHERVAALEPHDAAARARALDHQRLDLLLLASALSPGRLPT